MVHFEEGWKSRSKREQHFFPEGGGAIKETLDCPVFKKIVKLGNNQ